MLVNIDDIRENGMKNSWILPENFLNQRNYGMGYELQDKRILILHYHT